MGELSASMTCLISEVPRLVLPWEEDGVVDFSKSSGAERRLMMKINGFHCSAGHSDSFVVDMESFVGDGIHTGDEVANAHLTIKKTKDRYFHPLMGSPSTSPPTYVSVPNSKNPPKFAENSRITPRMANSTDHPHQDHFNNTSISNVDGHQTKPSSHNINNTNQTNGKWGRRHQNSSRRLSPLTTPRATVSSSTSLFSSPRRVLFFFATMSSMGTILLIYLTLSMSAAAKCQTSGRGFDWQRR